MKRRQSWCDDDYDDDDAFGPFCQKLSVSLEFAMVERTLPRYDSEEEEQDREEERFEKA